MGRVSQMQEFQEGDKAMTTDKRIEKIETMLEQLLILLSGGAVDAGYRPPVLSIGQQALQLLRQGHKAESVALLKAHSKLRANQ